ncbi:MAG: hypothetical protein JWO36_3490 [Myxococcales bacterium]|nr:hypothetical protein [Myxococcales bacterium]
MKKLATAVAALSLSISAPVFACPNMDHDEAPQAPKTAEKPKDGNDTTAKAPAQKDAPKAQPKPADTAKAKETPAPAPSKDQPKKSGDKVSIR